jgi:hypothetical protein
MTPATDRDLLLLEPRLFNDLAFLGQLRARDAAATLVGARLTASTTDFAAAGVDAGHVALIDETPCEVIRRTGEHELEVTLIRADPADPPIPPSHLASGPFEAVVRSFGPQLARAYRHLLRLLAVGPEAGPCAPPESCVVSQGVVGELVARRALADLYAAAAAVTDDQSGLLDKADRHHRGFDRLLRRSVIWLDLNGDGIADTARRFDSLALERR